MPEYPQLMGKPFQSLDDRKALTVTDKGKPVKHRISTVDAARSVITRTVDAFRDAQYRNARIQAQKDGAAPYSQARLEELGLGNTVNVNFLEMDSILNQKAAAWHELFYEVPNLASFSPKPRTDELFHGYAKVLEEEFHELMLSQSWFLPFMDKARRDSDAFALGVGVWPGKWDWRCKSYNRGSFFFDPGAKLDPESLEYFFLKEDDITAGQLYRWAFTNEEAAKKEGWNLEAVKRLLISIYVNDEQQDGEGKRYSTSVWEDLQQRLRTGLCAEEVKEFERVKLIYFYVKEIESGKISHYILSESPLVSMDQKDEFLYKSEDSIEKVSHILWFLPFNCGDGYLKSVRGLASYIETHCDLSNRYLSQVFNAGFMSSSLIIQPQSGGDYSNAQIIRAGPHTVLPPGFNVIQRSTMVPNVSDLIPLRDLSISIMRNNTGVLRQHPEIEAEREAQKTARQVAEESAREARMEKAATQFDYGYLQAFYRETFRRLTNPLYLQSPIDRPGLQEARDFIQRLVDRGLPPDVALDLSKYFVLHVTKAIGMGSWGLKLDISGQIASMAPGMDEKGRRNALRDRAATLVGYANVDRYFAPVDRDAIPTDESSHAVLENNDLKEGASVLAAADQWHVSHLQVHIPMVIELMEAVEAGQVGNPRLMLAVMQQSVKHLDDHRTYIAVDPARQNMALAAEQVIKKALPVIQKLMQQVKQLEAVEQKIREQEGQTVREAEDTLKSREQELKAIELQGKLENERLKQESLNQMRADKTAEQMDIRREEVRGRLQIEAEASAAKQAIKAQEVASKAGRQ